MIDVSSLTRYYGTHAAVKDASFTIADNEIVGFLGLNGAGKSTTLKVLAGLLLPSSGSVKIDGVDIVQAPDSMRSRIGLDRHKVLGNSFSALSLFSLVGRAPAQ